MYTVNVDWKGKMRFDGTDADGRVVAMDASAIYGGNNEGVRPMELMLISLAGCTAIEVCHAMNKMRLSYDSFAVHVEADRREEIPQVFTVIRVHYVVTGQGLSLEKFRKAFELGAIKYCSVANMVKKACEVAYAFSVNGERHEYERQEA
ncbi:MAG: OsmC family protein [Solidesulfovibrio sp. DCME]|uniref:OsmC family protein n=1 Tax=Solidesulfovibrio sp. DCME TaxID=3447380 RepID=UPI003D11A8E8